jgi:hypothetical protein
MTSPKISTLYALGCSFFLFGCNLKHRTNTARTNDFSGAEGSGVRMGLKALSANQFPEIKFSDFMNKGSLGSPQIEQTGNLPGRMLQTFSPTMNIEIYPLQNSSIRRETLSVSSRFSNSRIVQAGMSLTLSPQLRVGAKIEIARNFRDSSQAAHALPFNLLQLPFSAENALSLSEGTYVGVPIDGSVAINVNGSFLAENGQTETRLFDFLRAGASGSLSGTTQGVLVANGIWRMQILRLEGNKVRVRVVEEDDERANAQASFSGQGLASFTFIPLGAAARALDIAQRVIDNARMVDGKITDLERLAQVPVLALPEPIRKAKDLAAILPTFNDETARRLDDGIKLTDTAVDLARKGSESLQKIIDDAVLNDVRKAQSQVMDKVDAVDGFIQRITNFTYNTDAAVKLSAKFARRHRFVADYLFDLSSLEAKTAYNHAVSGRSLWIGAKPRDMDWGTGLSNFTVAERLAAEDTGSPNARVQRNLLGESTQQNKALSVQFSGLMASTGFSESWKNNSVWARDANGQTEGWRAALWQFERNLNLIREKESEQLGSGILAPAQESTGQSDIGSYWFAWKRRLPSSRPSGMQTIFSEVLNYVGPLGFSYNLPQLFKGEFSGDKEATLLVLFSNNAMRTIFDPSRVSDDLLWKALGNVALTFDNTFGLPYNNFGGLPQQYSNSPSAQAACTMVTKAWGSAYCSFFGNEFIPKFAAARKSTDQWQRMKVFESFYSKGFLANKIGARLLVRYLIEVATLAYGKDAPQELTLQFFVRNSNDSSAYASPSFTSGTPDEILVLQTLGMMM